LEDWVMQVVAEGEAPLEARAPAGERVPLEQTELWRETLKVDACGKEVVRLVSVHNEGLARTMMKNWNVLTVLKQQVLLKINKSDMMHAKVGAQVKKMEDGSAERIAANDERTKEVRKGVDRIQETLNQSESELYFLRQRVEKEEQRSRELRARLTKFVTAEDDSVDHGEGGGKGVENVGAMLAEDGSLNIDHYINHNMEAVETIERSFSKVYSQVSVTCVSVV
jgi:hypothetical protein